MTVSRSLAALLLCTVAVCSAQAEEPAQGGSGVIDKTGRAVGKGAKAAAEGAEYVAEKVVNGVKRGANATAHAVERGGRATGKALGTAAEKVGLGDKSQAEDGPPPTGDGTGQKP
jgi:hypothetical protein